MANTNTPVSSLSIGGYDQVMGLTQELINSGLQALWRRNGLNRNFNFHNREIKFVDCKLGAPSIVVRYTESQPNIVVLRLHVSSGEFKYWKNEDDDDMTVMDIFNWVFAYPVDIGLQTVPADQLPALKELIDVPADYSVSRLMFDMASIDSTKLDKTLCSLPDLPPETIRNIATYLSLHVFLEDGDKSLTYLCHVDNQSVQATFPPTSLQFQTYPWLSPDGVPIGEGISGNAVYNCLLYNQMTGNKSPPTGKQLFLDWTGNVTTSDASNINDSSSNIGTFVLSKDLFWNNYLIPRFKILNQCAHYKVWNLKTDAWTPSHYRRSLNKQVASDGSDLTQAEWLNQETAEDGSPIWVWTKNYDLDTQHSQVGWEIGIEANAYAHNTSTIRPVPGTNMIHVVGVTEVHEWCQVWRGVIGEKGTIHDEDVITRRLEWNFHMWLASVRDGGLQITMENPIHNYTTVDDKRDLGYINGNFWDNNQFNVVDQMKTFEKYLSDDISDLHKLYYPAGGMLFYDNATFAKNGDVHMNVKFDANATVLGDRNPGAPVRTQPAAGSPLTSKNETFEESGKV